MTIVKYILSTLICTFLLACNSKGSQTNVLSSETKTDTITDTTPDLVAEDITTNETQQEYSPNYKTIQRGVYKPKSTDKEYIGASTHIIEGIRLTDTSFVDRHPYMYLANEQPIALFTNKHPKSKEDVAGIFKGGSLVMVDTVFYNKVYIDSDKAPMSFERWYALLDADSLSFDAKPLTYDVWYAIRINGKKYYTDYKLHNYIEYTKYIPSKNQILLVCSQCTGYDGGYDIGYPDYYEVAVLEQTADKKAWTQIYRSPKLDLNDGGSDEYGISDYLMSKEPKLDTQGNFVIDLENLCKLTWNGRKLIVDWYKNKDY